MTRRHNRGARPGRGVFNCPAAGKLVIVTYVALSEEIRYVARNRKARHDYQILGRLEAGIELRGS